MTDLLANPIWHSLSTRHSDLAQQGNHLAKRYRSRGLHPLLPRESPSRHRHLLAVLPHSSPTRPRRPRRSPSLRLHPWLFKAETLQPNSREWKELPTFRTLPCRDSGLSFCALAGSVHSVVHMVAMPSADLSNVFSKRVRASGVGAGKGIIMQFPSRLSMLFDATIWMHIDLQKTRCAFIPLGDRWVQMIRRRYTGSFVH
jgi:hypothetical protein